MCVGPMIGASTPQPKPAAQQTSEAVAETAPAVRLLEQRIAIARAMRGSVYPRIPVKP